MAASRGVLVVAFAAFVAVALADGVTRLPSVGEKGPSDHEEMMQAFASEKDHIMNFVKEATDFVDEERMKMARLSLADARGQGETSSSEEMDKTKEEAGKGQMILLTNSRDVLGRRGGPFLYAATIVRHVGDSGVGSPGDAMAALAGSLLNLPRGLALGIQGGDDDGQEFVNEVMRAFDCPRMRQRMLDGMMMNAQMQRDMWSNRLPGSDERTSFHQYEERDDRNGQDSWRSDGHHGMSRRNGMGGWLAMEDRMPMIHDASDLLRMPGESGPPEMHHWWDSIPFLSNILQEEDIPEAEMPTKGQKAILGQDPITWGPNGFKMGSGKLIEVIPLDDFKKQDAYSSIDWRFWDDEGNLNYGAILFMFLVGACAAVWLSLVVQIFECMFGSADDDEYVILSDDDDDMKCDAFYYHAKSGSIVTAEGVPVDDVAFIKGAIVMNKTSDEHVEKA